MHGSRTCVIHGSKTRVIHGSYTCPRCNLWVAGVTINKLLPQLICYISLVMQGYARNGYAGNGPGLKAYNSPTLLLPSTTLLLFSPTLLLPSATLPHFPLPFTYLSLPFPYSIRRQPHPRQLQHPEGVDLGAAPAEYRGGRTRP